MMSETKQTWKASPFYDAWNKAFLEYNKKLPEGERVSLKDSRWHQIKNYQDLVDTIDKDHGNFDSERHTSFTEVLKRFCTGISALTDLSGGAASIAFPPCSQIFGAVSVLIGAGKKATGAFDAVDGLFQRLDAFVRRLEPLTEHDLDKPLEEVVVSLLVALLGLCALATRRVCLDEDMGADWAKRHPHVARMKRSAKSKTKEFFTQLFNGGDDKINAAVADIERLVDAESRMTLALVKSDTAEMLNRIDGVTVDIQGLSLKIYDIKYEIQKNAEGVAVGLVKIEAKIDHLQETVQSDHAELKVYQERQLAELSAGRLELQELKASMRSFSAAQSTLKSANPDVTKARKHAKLLNTLLKPSLANYEACQRAEAERQALGTCNWILQN